MAMISTHGSGVHLIAKGQAMWEARGTIICTIWRGGIFGLRGMSSQGSLGSEGILVRNAILRSNVLKDLLVDLAEFSSSGIWESMRYGGIREAGQAVWLCIQTYVPVAAMGRSGHALGIRAAIIIGIALPLVRGIVISCIQCLVWHGTINTSGSSIDCPISDLTVSTPSCNSLVKSAETCLPNWYNDRWDKNKTGKEEKRKDRSWMPYVLVAYSVIFKNPSPRPWY
jgi:hypothetical protein